MNYELKWLPWQQDYDSQTKYIMVAMATEALTLVYKQYNGLKKARHKQNVTTATDKLSRSPVTCCAYALLAIATVLYMFCTTQLELRFRGEEKKHGLFPLTRVNTKTKKKKKTSR